MQIPQSVSNCSDAKFVILIDEKSDEVGLSASEDWDVKTITSALKLYLR